MIPILIIAALTLVTSVAAWTSQRNATETERTIRLAIEQGVLTDPTMILALREPAGLSWIERFVLLGIMILFACAGVVLIALALIVTGTGFPTPLFVLSAFSAVVGGGFIYCGRWLRKTRERG